MLNRVGGSFFPSVQNFFRGNVPAEPLMLSVGEEFQISFHTDKSVMRHFQMGVLKECFHVSELESERWFMSKVKSGDYVVALATEGGEILGGIVIERSWSMKEKVMLIAWLAVSEKHRGRDIGTLLVEQAVAYAKENGALVLLGEVENPEVFEEEEPAYGDPVKRVKFYTRLGCKRLEVPYVVQVRGGLEEFGMMMTLFPLSEEQRSATELCIPEFSLFMEELVGANETAATEALIAASTGSVRMTDYHELYGS